MEDDVPIYEYHCPKCNAKKERFCPVEARDAPVMCERKNCGTYMHLVEVPRPAAAQPRFVRDVFKKVGG